MITLPEFEAPAPKFKVLYSEGIWNDIEVVDDLIYFHRDDGRFFTVNVNVWANPNSNQRPIRS